MNISIPTAVQRESNEQMSIITAEHDFRETWANKLDLVEHWTTFRHVEYVTVVRLLLVIARDGGDSVRAEIQRLRDTETLLTVLGVHQRDKEAWFTKGDGQRGLTLLDGTDNSLLSDLDVVVAAAPEETRNQCFTIGIEMLAERIAAQVQQARKP